jgi:molybdopterin converting factor small subunit
VKVQVKLIASYRKLLPPDATGNRFDVEIEPGTTIRELLSRYGVPLTEDSVILINGLTSDGLDQVLVDGDQVAAFSAMAGG